MNVCFCVHAVKTTQWKIALSIYSVCVTFCTQSKNINMMSFDVIYGCTHRNPSKHAAAHTRHTAELKSAFISVCVELIGAACCWCFESRRPHAEILSPHTRPIHPLPLFPSKVTRRLPERPGWRSLLSVCQMRMRMVAFIIFINFKAKTVPRCDPTYTANCALIQLSEREGKLK